MDAPPPPAGVAQVPSPRQKVEDDADVPELRFVTGRLPVTPVVSGNPVQLVSVPDAGVPSTGATNESVVPLVVAPVIPPKTPELLYWTWVLLPPGVPPPDDVPTGENAEFAIMLPAEYALRRYKLQW